MKRRGTPRAGDPGAATRGLISTPEGQAIARDMAAIEKALQPLMILRSAGFEVMSREEVLAEARVRGGGIEAIERIVKLERTRVDLQAAGVNGVFDDIVRPGEGPSAADIKAAMKDIPAHMRGAVHQGPWHEYDFAARYIKDVDWPLTRYPPGAYDDHPPPSISTEPVPPARPRRTANVRGHMVMALAMLGALAPAETGPSCTCGKYSTNQDCPVHGDRR